MKYTRRDFVKFGGAVAAAALCLPNLGLAAAKYEGALMRQTAKSFRDLQGSEFYIWNEDVSMNAILKNIEDFPNKTKNGECFSLVFETRLKRTKESTYYMFHQQIGNFQLFLTEANSGKRGALIATINRL